MKFLDGLKSRGVYYAWSDDNHEIHFLLVIGNLNFMDSADIQPVYSNLLYKHGLNFI